MFTFSNFWTAYQYESQGEPAKTIIKANTLRSPAKRQAHNVVRTTSRRGAVQALREGPKQ